MGTVSPHFSKPLCKFFNQMVFGLQSAKDIKLSNVARALDEPIALKKTEERLSRNLAAVGMDEKLNAIIAAQGASRIGRDTLVIVDPTDIRKEYAEKMPYLTTIHDGSSGELLATGYSGCMAVACEPSSQMVIRLLGNRHVIFSGRPREELEVAEGCAMKYAETIVKESRKGEKTYHLEFGARKAAFA